MPLATPHSTRRRAFSLLIASVVAFGGATHAGQPSLADSPIRDFRLSLYDDETGRKTSDLRGSTALYHGNEEVELRDFTLTLLNQRGTLALKVAGAKALLHVKPRVAEGDESIEVQGPGYSLVGKRWRCDEPARKITIREQAHVVFQAPLIDILK